MCYTTLVKATKILTGNTVRGMTKNIVAVDVEVLVLTAFNLQGA